MDVLDAISERESYSKDGEELLKEAQEYMADKHSVIYNRSHYHPWRKNFYEVSDNKAGLMQTVNYIAEMEKTLEKQAEELDKQVARSNEDIFKEKNDEIKRLNKILNKFYREKAASMDLSLADLIMNQYYTHVLEEGGSVKGHQLHFSVFYGPLGSCRECKCECGKWQWKFGDEENW